MAVVKNQNSDKAKALQAAMDQIEKQFGKGSIMRLGENKGLNDIESISTGSLSLDIALGIGGLPCGRIVEIYGPESSGKTTLTLELIAEAQKKGKTCAFIDAEHALDPIYASKLGVDVNSLLVSQPDTGEQALDICDMLVRSGSVDVVIIDSVAALVPKAEIEGDMGESHMGLQARLMSQALRKLTGSINQANCMCVFINQLRMKIGVMFGNPETLGDELIGNETKVKVVKNKVAPPFKTAEFQILYGKGISKESEIVDLGVKCNIIAKSGAWFSYKGEKIGQGKTNVMKYLEQNASVSAEIEGLIREAYRNKDDYTEVADIGVDSLTATDSTSSFLTDDTDFATADIPDDL